MSTKYLEQSYVFDINEDDFSGREIRLKRNVDLAAYNDYDTVAKAIDWQVRCDSENQEFDLVTRRIIKAYADRFILQATEDGIKRYEAILDLEPEGTLEDRRRKVFFMWNKNIIYTDRTLRSMLDVLVGKNKYIMTLKYNEYGFYLNVFVDKDVDLVELSKIVREILPANLTQLIEVSFGRILELETQAGDYSFPYLRCGEHLAGMEPHILFKGEVFAKELVLDTGEDTAREYKHFGHLRAGEKVNSKNDDLVFRHLSPLDSRYEDSEVFILEDWTND